MSRPAVLVYKCRLCGGERASLRVRDGARFLGHFMGNAILPPDLPEPFPHLVHDCPGGRRQGIADFVGVQFDVDPEGKD